MHPHGFLDPATYEIIGAAYRELEEKEPWLDGTTSVADIAILSQEAIYSYYNDPQGQNRGSSVSDVGAVRIMLEGNYLFDMIDTYVPLDKYKLLILPDSIRLDDALTKKIRVFIENGGKVLASGLSGLSKTENKFVLDLGAEYVSPSSMQPVYLRPRFEMEGQPNAAYVIYSPAQAVRANGEVLVDLENPYFNRTAEHFCSHRHTPNNPDVRFPGVTVGRDGAYVTANLFSEYATCGCLIAKRILMHIIDYLLEDKKTVVTTLPVQGVNTLMEQKDQNRFIYHMLFASTVKRGNGVEIIEEILPVYDLTSQLRLGFTPSSVRLVPSGEIPEYSVKDGVLTIHVPKLYIHQMIEICR
jgi:hypothetical protein